MSDSATTTLSDALKSLRVTQSDYLRVSANKELITFLEKNQARNTQLETVVFSDSTLKINKRGREQERNLVITNLSLYNFVPGGYKKCQRSIPLSALRGVAMTRDSDELLFQVSKDYDYRFRIVRRAEVCETVAKHYEKLTGKKLPTMFSDDLDAIQITKDNLKDLQAQQDEQEDAQRGNSSSVSAEHQQKQRRVSESKQVDEPPPVEGWLAKKGHSNDIWRRRFFRLGGANLRYYEARTKGSTTLTAGVVRSWANNRYGVVVREAREPSTPDHLKNILADMERREAFMKFCASIYSEENAHFYVAVEGFRRLPQGATQLQVAEDIYKKFIANGAPSEISAPHQAQGDLSKAILVEKKVSPDIFDQMQRVVLSIMRVDLLPQYLAFAQKQAAQEDYSVKSAMTDGDKKVESCTGCTVKFSLMKRRTFCQYCNFVYCSSCVSKHTTLPAEFNHKNTVHVCDMCFGILGKPAAEAAYAFTYASPERPKPLNLAAGNLAERDAWLAALRYALARAARGNDAVPSGDVHAVKLTGPPVLNESKENRETEVTHLEGWLWKEDPTTGSWRRRYFVLSGQRLWYYEMGLKGHIPVTQGLSVYATDKDKPALAEKESTFGGFSSESGFSWRFNISNNERVYQVAADTQDEQAYWMEALTTAVQSEVVAADDEKMPDDLAVITEAYNEKAPEGRVTFVFTDVQNSTKLWETEPDAMNEGLEIHDKILRELLKKYRGYEVKTEGDAFMVTFFSAIDAILWCIAVQRELLKQAWPDDLLRLPAASTQYAADDAEKKNPVFNGIRIRMGIHVGEPSCRKNPVTGRMDYFGQVVNRSARVSDSGHGGQIVCTQEVQSDLKEAQDSGKFTENVIVDELGDFPYKGVSTLLKVFQITPTDLKGRNPFPPLRIEHKGKPKKEEAAESES